MSKKCIAIHLPVDLLEKINEQKATTGQSQNGFLIDLIEKGLGKSSTREKFSKLYFFGKVRIDTSKMQEFGKKLQKGEIDTSHTLLTFCMKDDPTIGLNFWVAESHEEFEKTIAQYKFFYKETEIFEVITPTNAMKLIMEKGL